MEFFLGMVVKFISVGSEIGIFAKNLLVKDFLMAEIILCASEITSSVLVNRVLFGIQKMFQVLFAFATLNHEADNSRRLFGVIYQSLFDSFGEYYDYLLYLSYRVHRFLVRYDFFLIINDSATR